MLCEWQPPVPTLWHEHRYQVPVLFGSELGSQSVSLMCQLSLHFVPYMLPLKTCHTRIAIQHSLSTCVDRPNVLVR